MTFRRRYTRARLLFNVDLQAVTTRTARDHLQILLPGATSTGSIISLPMSAGVPGSGMHASHLRSCVLTVFSIWRPGKNRGWSKRSRSKSWVIDCRLTWTRPKERCGSRDWTRGGSLCRPFRAGGPRPTAGLTSYDWSPNGLSRKGCQP